MNPSRLYLIKLASFALMMGIISGLLYYLTGCQTWWDHTSFSMVAFALAYVLVDLWNGKLRPLDSRKTRGSSIIDV